ncbi:DUF3131 domain-containing protein [Pseudotabrizicola sp. L79]|uniref:DUF3131 domain-containing protein n=1 Tax=Pseudotabrizicola sp. L79 TaxID=3118402 RepID=UPI002F959CDE
MTGLAAAPAFAAPRTSFGWVAPKPVRTLVALTDIGVSTSPEALDAVLGIFTVKGLPVHLIVAPEAAEGQGLQPDHPVSALLRRYLLAFPGLIELVAFSPDLARLRPFQVARSAAQARHDLVQAIWPKDARDASLARLGTIACGFEADPKPVASVRSAGFRNVLAIGEDRPTEVIARMSGVGVLSLSGGERVSLQKTPVLPSFSGRTAQHLVAVSAASLAAAPAETVATLASRFADEMLLAEIDERIALPLARDLQMRIDAKFRRHLALHLLTPPDGQDSGMAAFHAMLSAKGVPFSHGPAIGTFPQAETYGDAYWIAVSDPLDGVGPVRAPAISTLRRGNPANGNRWIAQNMLPTGQVVTLNPDPTAQRGFDSAATLHLPLLAYFDGPLMTGTTLLKAIDDAEDGVVVISPQAVATAAMRSGLMALISPVHAATGTAILPLDQYVRRILPGDGLLPAFLRTEAFIHRSAAALQTITSAEREELIGDAQVAWRYFAEGTHASTGLCPSTLRYNGGFDTDYTYSTMWDVGSQINAIMAASELGLITEQDFSRRIDKILATLARATRSGLKLPPEEIDTASGRGRRRFNSFDTGRLLLALDHLRRFQVPVDGVEDLVASWNFDSVVVDGRFNSIQGGKLVDDYRSHYTSYAAAGLRAWGITAVSPYDPLTAEGGADAKMELLDVVSTLGPIGAEPALLHLLDVGDQFAAKYLSDVLMAAQQTEWTARGNLFAPSETPIDRSPWFTYQGLGLNRGPDAWAVDADFANETQRAPEFRASLRATSSKAAYLWRAVRKDEFTDRLLHFVRRNARVDQGFKSAIYHSSDIQMSDYFDINTSGIILQSIARILSAKAN